MGKPPVVPESLDFTEDPSLAEGVFPAVLRIHDILVWIRIRIRIRRSMPLTNGSGSFYFHHWPSRCQQKKFSFLLFEGTFTSFFKDKKSKRSHKTVKIKVFLRIHTSGSGSGAKRFKNMWIRIRIRNTGFQRCNGTLAGLGYSAGGWDGHAKSPMGFTISVLNYQAMLHGHST
jgi:hypothetical protein